MFQLLTYPMLNGRGSTISSKILRRKELGSGINIEAWDLLLLGTRNTEDVSISSLSKGLVLLTIDIY